MSGHAAHASGFKAWRLFATGYKRFRVCLRPCPLGFESPASFLRTKKGPKWDPSFKSYWRRAGD